MKFTILTRQNLRKLEIGQKLTEHGITFERQKNGDGRFSVNIMVDGQRIHRVIGKESDGTTRTQAEEFIEKVRMEAKQGRLNLPRGRKTVQTFEQAAEQYLAKQKEEGGKDLKSKTHRLRQHVIPFFKSKPLNQIATFDVERYKKQRLEAKAAHGTINRELAVLSHLLHKAMEWRWLDHKPCNIKQLKEEKSRIVYLTTEQMRNLIEVAKGDQNPHLYPFIVIGLETSMRRSEILSIRLEHIDLEKRVIYIPKAKAGAREQPITQHLADFLRGYIEIASAGQEWLFPAIAARSGHVMNIEKPWKRIVEAAGLDPKVVVRHTLRHTAITHLVQAGIDLPTVKRISGHKTLAMVERYSHQNGAHIQAAMDKLEKRYRIGE